MSFTSTDWVSFGIREEFFNKLIHKLRKYLFSKKGGNNQANNAQASLRWDFTRAECEVLPPCQLTAADLITKLEEIKGRSSFQTAGHLKGFLETLPPERVFDEGLFRDFWNQFCYEIKPDEWNKHYP